MSELVSIIVPVFNGANYMRAAIDSALAQTWPATEVLVVDDGSNDGGATDEIARSYGDRIRYIRKPNGGVASALNAGIAAMRGEVFCWLSHDDRHWPNKIKLQMAEWDRLGRAGVVLISDYRLIDETGATITDVRLDHRMLASKPQYTLLRGSIHGCSVFVPKCLFDKVGNFKEDLPTTQDYDLWHRMQRAGVKFIHMPDILIDSRWHDEQGSKKIDHIREATQFWLRVIDDIPIEERVALEGSNAKFLSEMANFLGRSKLPDAAAALQAKAHDALPLVSVVIPVYNRFQLLPGAIESAIKQTYGAIEVILVDDGSTDDPAFLTYLVRRYAPRVKLIRQRNSGPAAARNAGWQVARGEYIAFLDSDDLFLPRKVEVQLAAMTANNAVFSQTSYSRYWAGVAGTQRQGSGAHNRFPDIIGGCSIATPTVMLKTSLRDEFQFPEHVRIGEDNILWLKIAARHGVLGIDEALTLVRASADSSGYDKEKLKAGVSNVYAEIMKMPELAKHESQVARLAAFIATIDESASA
jgi:glycosyltransferase involved in cell wall biosynthesis